LAATEAATLKSKPIVALCNFCLSVVIPGWKEVASSMHVLWWSLAPWLITSACLAYAFLRYVVFQTGNAPHVPAYVVNKAVSLSGLIFLAWSRCYASPQRRRSLGTAGLVLIALHLGLSITILTPSYFPKFYLGTGRMTWQAEFSMLMGMVGVLLLGSLWAASRQTDPAEQSPARGLRRFFGRLVLLSTALHVAFMGYSGWLRPETWPGGLPPITLLSFLVALAGLAWPGKNNVLAGHAGKG